MNFKNTQVAFSLKSNRELKKAKFLFTIIRNNMFAKLAKPMIDFLLAIKFPIEPILKKNSI